MKKVLLTSVFALFAFTFSQAQSSVSCQDGSCVVTTPCETKTVPGNRGSISSRSTNGKTIIKAFVDGNLVLTCETESAPSPDRPSLCERFPLFCRFF